ncbi:helix-turn-helix transcriptional regulator [Sulfitobacter sp. M57]|uniref:helix-turn-helix transcriptional regulator n=1 Tax=unclassified Sulfitobacter TaxID=196795 RepID=UPI0023E32C96|nr:MULTISPECIES: helix-turn-helix transcriptional regulator [unclassified Sulfitobacter]MDF3413760.1 helix-turn-helix transcriptional regulator [Sulfitobacter sp. KE5]MDF3420959.1 helix-turn-helix transcriptional regulator [Sulfitobacter sp. KE43]MDF3432306.1 helix-turn-helix transcriptional regulator [Sulfitobacter sp. KE42]MDF3457945.1 helix-turn-helix transcriptional regulator [Sulfitobacter sp. S74]MDF3461846.1 helix-turn-helix transcriptional regulator [Sulfitobacter sp. Ks18]
MLRYWVSGFAMVFGIAALKTFLLVGFVLDRTSTDIATVVGLFALFFALTSAVAYIGFKQLGRYQKRLRQKQRQATSDIAAPAAKESVIARYAPEWGLSQAEADVAIFVAKGFSNSEVAEMRGCAIATVKSQLSSIYQKSGMTTRYQLIAFVTDEICAQVNETDAEKHQKAVAVPTRQILPLVGRNKDTEHTAMQA